MRFDLKEARFVHDRHSDQTLAVIGADRSLTWLELERETQAWVDAARARGIGPNVPVALHGHKEAAFFVAIAGCLSLKAPFVPIDTIYPRERRERIVEIVQAATVYETATGTFTPGVDAIVPMQEHDLAYVMFTSGSTGDPKGVQIGREGPILMVQWMRQCFDLGDTPVFMNQAPFSFDLSMYEVFATLALGGTCVLNSREQIAAAGTWMTRLAANGITTWVSTPSFAHQQMLNPMFSQAGLPTLKTFLFCGEPLPAPLAKKLRTRFPDVSILNTYGPTEATVATTWVRVDDALLAQHPSLPVGYAKPDSNVWVDNGELCISGDHVMRGYLNRPDLNAGKLFLDSEGKRAFRTGDLGVQGEDGLLFCRGRMDDQIKLNGYRIELSEIDSALDGMSGVVAGACAVLRRPDGTAVRLIGFIEPVRPTGASVADAVGWPVMPGFELPPGVGDWKGALAVRLPPYMVPSELVACESMPMSANHKIDRKKLLEIYASLGG
jgi:D-alanine--poly(phosphoribitol) ligase subunit 1